MSSNKKSLYEIIKDYFFSFIENEEYYARSGSVVSVDLTQATAKVKIVDGAEIEDVRLQQVKNATGWLVVPAIGSNVIVDFTDNTTAHVATYSEVEEIIYQNGSNGGMVKVSELVGKLNTLENDLNTLKTAFISWVPVVNDGGLALKAISATWASQTITTTVVADLENEKIKH